MHVLQVPNDLGLYTLLTLVDLLNIPHLDFLAKLQKLSSQSYFFHHSN